MSDDSLHRELCRRQHRILGLELLLQAWVNQIDSLIMDREQLSNFLGIARFKSSRLTWLEEDLYPYFRHQSIFYKSSSPDSLHSIVLSRIPLDDMPDTTMTSEKRAAAARAVGIRMELVTDLETFDANQTEADMYSFVSLLAAGLADLPEVNTSYEERHTKKIRRASHRS
jgi:hypothetical protein